jgi:hypothetical protein
MKENTEFIILKFFTGFDQAGKKTVRGAGRRFPDSYLLIIGK